MTSQLLRTCGPVVPNDSGPAPTETLLAALGACLATTYTSKAAAQGVKVDGLEVLLEGRLDLQGLFGLAPVRPGLSGITATLRVRCEADDEVLKELGRQTVDGSPMYASIANPVEVNTSIERVS